MDIIYKLYDNFKNLFHHTQTASKTGKVSGKSNKITFEVTDNADVKIKLDFELTSDEASETLGAFFYELTTGSISQSILDIMIDLSKEYPNHSELVKKSILIWVAHATSEQNLYKSKKHNDDDTPIIQPTQFSSVRASS
jgi:hypothetical protein